MQHYLLFAMELCLHSGAFATHRIYFVLLNWLMGGKKLFSKTIYTLRGEQDGMLQLVRDALHMYNQILFLDKNINRTFLHALLNGAKGAI